MLRAQNSWPQPALGCLCTRACCPAAVALTLPCLHSTLQLPTRISPRYGLSEAELREVEEQLLEVAAARAGSLGTGAGMLPEAKAAVGGARARAQRDAELLGECRRRSRGRRMQAVTG